MKRLVNRLDPTRLVTAAMDNGFGEGITEALDVIGFNYRHEKMDDFHARFPKLPIIGSESGSTVSTRGEYARDEAKLYVPAYDTDAPLVGDDGREVVEPRGRSAVDGRRLHLDRLRLSRRADAVQSLAQHQLALRGAGHLRLPEGQLLLLPRLVAVRAAAAPAAALELGRPRGQPIAVWAHSNLDRVELFLNGKSQGVRDVARNHHVEWSVPYAPGVIEAHGYRNGKVVLRERRETAGPAAALRLTADRYPLKADGQDVAIFKVEVLDAKGQSRAARRRSGGVRGRGARSGDRRRQRQSDQSRADVASQRKAFNGLCQVIVRMRRGKAGEVRVTASARGLKGASVVLKAEA
jgi:beta-galactosidase